MNTIKATKSAQKFKKLNALNAAPRPRESPKKKLTPAQFKLLFPSDSFKTEENLYPGGGAMTKKRKYKNRKTKKRKYKNRKTKNSKTKNRKTKNRKKYTYIGGISDKGFMNLLQQKAKEEYEDLFVIKAEDKDKHKRGQLLQNNTGFRKNSSQELLQNNTIFRKNSSQENETPYTQQKNETPYTQQKNETPYTQQKNETPYTQQKNSSQITTGGSKGKATWDWICEKFERQVRADPPTLNIKISSMSSEFNDDIDATYGGIIFWHNKGNGHISNIDGNELRAIYVLIQNTQEWPADHFKDVGQGQVHDHLYKQVMGNSMSDGFPENAACSSGFSIFHDHHNEENGWCIKFSSRWLNSNTLWNGIQQCGSNESKMTNQGEAIIIIGAVMQWMNPELGTGSYVNINHIPEQWRYNAKILEDFYWPLNSGNTSVYDKNTWYTPYFWSCIPAPAPAQNK